MVHYLPGSSSWKCLLARFLLTDPSATKAQGRKYLIPHPEVHLPPAFQFSGRDSCCKLSEFLKASDLLPSCRLYSWNPKGPKMVFLAMWIHLPSSDGAPSLCQALCEEPEIQTQWMGTSLEGQQLRKHFHCRGRGFKPCWGNLRSSMPCGVARTPPPKIKKTQWMNNYNKLCHTWP